MAEEIIYCANGCTRNYNGDRRSVLTIPPALICERCEEDLRRWLREIPQRFELLPQFVENGSTPKEPDAQIGKRTDAPAPMRLEIIDLMDRRLGRRWNGTIPTDKRRGALGTVHDHAERIRDELTLQPVAYPTVQSEADLISRHMLWLVKQDWISELATDMERLHSTLGYAIGERKPKPVGSCEVTDAEGECGGPLLPSRLGGVHCPRCGAVWGIDDLQRLGMVLGQQEPA